MGEMRNDSMTAAKALSANMTMFIQLLGLGVALWAPLIVIMIWMSGNFTAYPVRLWQVWRPGSLRRFRIWMSRLSTRIQDLDDRLSARIQDLDDRIDSVDNKLVAIGDMTVIAFTDGEISSDELEAIWARASST